MAHPDCLPEPPRVTAHVRHCWIDGQRLDRSDAADVPRLCAVAMNTYLTMMLEQPGVLHADPHPGNLLRARDGRLCILDWGLVTTIPRGRQVVRYPSPPRATRRVRMSPRHNEDGAAALGQRVPRLLERRVA